MPEGFLTRALAERIEQDFGLRPVVAGEIEFYLRGSDVPSEAFWYAFKESCKNAGIALFNCEKERGEGQLEVSLTPQYAAKAVSEIEEIRRVAGDVARELGMEADFSAKPFADQPGSGLHIHIHLENKKNESVYYKKDEQISDALKFSIGGLLAWLPDCMPVFAPNAESYARFVPNGQTPVNVSWGANNRTVAVRLPDAAGGKRHIEHRVAGADAEADKVVAVVLAAIHDGLTRKLEPGAQMYGDAGLPAYSLPEFPLTLEAARVRMEQSEAVKRYFGDANMRDSSLRA